MPVLDEKFKMSPKYNWYSKILRGIFKIRRNKLFPPKPISDRDIFSMAEAGKKLVIQVFNGGLGDHLVYSALPELLWKQKQIKVYISTRSVFRNQQIWDFVWGRNPYAAFTDDNGWYIHRPLPFHEECKTVNAYLMRLFHLDADDSPRIYYRPQVISLLEGKTVIDASFGPSGRANGYFEKVFLQKFINYIRQNVGDFVLLKYSNVKYENPLQMELVKCFSPQIAIVDSIERLCDVLASAQKRYLMYSGSASVSAALKLESVVLCNRCSCENFKYSINSYIKL